MYIVHTKVLFDGVFYQALLIIHCFINAQRVAIVLCNPLKFSIYEALKGRLADFTCVHSRGNSC